MDFYFPKVCLDERKVKKNYFFLFVCVEEWKKRTNLMGKIGKSIKPPFSTDFLPGWGGKKICTILVSSIYYFALFLLSFPISPYIQIRKFLPFFPISFPFLSFLSKFPQPNIVLGTRSCCMWKLANGPIQAWAKVIWPAREKHWAFQPFNFCLIFYRMWPYFLLELHPLRNWAPNFLLISLVSLNLHIIRIWSLLLWGTFLENRI